VPRYVYYRVGAGDEAAAVAAVRALHARWTAEGVACELLRRVEEPGEPVTLMEIYREAAPPALAALEAEAVTALAPWLIGERHLEDFEPCA
jgi:Domain of unknown function (DUF4936)